MVSVLLAAALVVGSGDGRHGATDGRTEQIVPAFTLVRVGMTSDEVECLCRGAHLAAQCEYNAGTTIVLVYEFGPDRLGSFQSVSIRLDGWRVVGVTVDPVAPRAGKK
jgi:hypothetical protein